MSLKIDNLLNEIKADLRSTRLLPGLSVGLVLGLMVVILQVSFASMIFSGQLENHVGKGIGMLIAGSLIFVLVTTLLSGIRSVVALPQDAPVALYAGVAAAISAGIGNPESLETYITITAGLVVSGLLTGLFFYLVGHFKLAELFRFMPYPVISGFLAGTGWLLSKGSLEVMTGINLTFETLSLLLTGEVLVLWLPGVAYALILFFLLRRFSNFLILPGSLVISVALYYLVLALTGTPMATAREAGMLFESFGESTLWPAFGFGDFSSVNWSLVIRQMPAIAIIPFISLLGFLLNTGGVETAAKKEFDMNRELKANGLANALAGLAGAHPGYNALSLSALGLRIGAYTRLVGLTVVVFLSLTLVFGSSVLVLFPKAVLGGFLLLLGLFFISDWLIDTAKKMPRSDHLLVLAIFLIISIFGYLQGVVFGLFATILFFVIRFSKVPIISSSGDLSSIHSSRHRTLPQQKLLAMQGKKVAIYNLKGYIFFGSVTGLINHITSAVKNAGVESVDLVILNFETVSGYDISSVNNFIRLINRFADQKIMFIFSAAPKGFTEMLTQNLDQDSAGMVKTFPHAETAMQWAEDYIIEHENLILKSSSKAGQTARDSLFDSASEEMLQALDRQAQLEMLIDKFSPYLNKNEYRREETVLAGQAEAPGICLVVSGVISELTDTAEDHPTKLRDLGPGTFFAEAAAYGSRLSPYTYQAKTDAQVAVLSAESILQLEEIMPHEAALLHRLVIGQWLK
jgi:sulfate permease, SulP family